MIEINLIPDVKLELIKAQKVRSTVITGAIIVGIASVSVVALLGAYVFGVQAVRNSYDDGKIREGSEKLSSVKDLSKMLTIQNQLNQIQGLNDGKKIDSRIFDVLVAIIPPEPNNIDFSDLTINASESTIVINGQASKSYAALETFKKTISGAKIKYTDANNTKQEVPLVSEVSATDTSYGEDSSGQKVLKFKIKMKYDEALFSPLSKNLRISIANKGNVTDSYLGLPKSLFVEPAKDIKE